MERKVLGRGLEALIPISQDTAREKVQMLKISQIRSSRFQPRFIFSPEKIEDLARSIKEKGVIQPILVRATSDDFYELIKDITSNDKEFHKFTFDNYRIRICYDKEKDRFYLECYS